MSTDSTTPDTIVLIHGFWVTPRSWEHWIDRYEQAGYRVIAPAYPGFEVEVEALNADTSPIEALTVPAVVEHLEGVVGELESPPILIGHSAGGTFVQLLLDHGFGAVGVAINSAPTEGVRVTPPSQIKSLFPALKNPANRHRAVGFTAKQWHYVFTNTFSEDESQALYERYHVPASGGILWGIVLANLEPGHQATWVDYKNDNRAPLLFISGGEDHLMPPSVQRSNAKHYKSNTITEVKEYEGRAHLLPAKKAGRKSPTTPSTGRSPTRRSRQQLPQISHELTTPATRNHRGSLEPRQTGGALRGSRPRGSAEARSPGGLPPWLPPPALSAGAVSAIPHES